MKNNILLLCLLFSISFISVYADDSTTQRTEIQIDWIDENRFDITESDVDVKIEIINRSNNEVVDNRMKIEGINASNYNDFDRIIRIEFDADRSFTCSNAQITNITKTVDKLVDHCATYQDYINGTVQFADKMAEWQAEAAKQKEIVRQKEGEVTEARTGLNSTQSQLDGCSRDKENYYSDWEGCDREFSVCDTDLRDAEDSFAGKYLIGAIIGAVVVFIFTRKEKDVASEEEEFEEVEY